jgi:hypothetical protein
MAAEEIAGLRVLDTKLKKIKAELETMVLERASGRIDLTGIGRSGRA